MVNVVQSTTSSSYLNQLSFGSYDGGCVAVIDKLTVSSIKPVGRPALHEAVSNMSILDGVDLDVPGYTVVCAVWDYTLVPVSCAAECTVHQCEKKGP